MLASWTAFYCPLWQLPWVPEPSSVYHDDGEPVSVNENKNKRHEKNCCCRLDNQSAISSSTPVTATENVRNGMSKLITVLDKLRSFTFGFFRYIESWSSEQEAPPRRWERTLKYFFYESSSECGECWTSGGMRSSTWCQRWARPVLLQWFPVDGRWFQEPTTDDDAWAEKLIAISSG